MELMSANWPDIAKYYQSTFVLLKEVPDQYIYINKVSPREVLFTDADGKEGVIYLHDAHPYTLDMVLPSKTLYQMGKHAFLITRIPARQYHRGIGIDNAKVLKLESTGWKSVSLSFDVLKGQLTTIPYKSLEASINDPVNISEVLSKRFCYRSHDKSIFCDLTCIGDVLKKTRTINVKRLFVPNIQRLLGENSSYKVVPI